MDVKYNPKHGTPEERIAKRLRNSGGEEAQYTVKTGEGPQRVFHNSHETGNVRRHGGAPYGNLPGEGNGGER